MIKELSGICLNGLDAGDAQWAIDYWNGLSDADLFDELADARADYQMAKDEGRWEDGDWAFSQ